MKKEREREKEKRKRKLEILQLNFAACVFLCVCGERNNEQWQENRAELYMYVLG